MIRPIDIKLNAAYPELPLAEASTFTGSPSAVFIRGVPSNCGRWAITAVSVAATYPDNSTTTCAAVQSANGVWVATLPATATSGRTANGIRILADGIDENGAAVSGYILGVADFAVATLGVSPAPSPGETSYQMLYFDEVPSVARKGDVAKIDGVLKWYDGTAWQPFESIDLSIYASRAEVEAGWWSGWTILRDGVDVTSQVAQPVWDAVWNVSESIVSGDVAPSGLSGGENTPTLSWTAEYTGPDDMETAHYTATRHRVAAPVPTKPSDIGAQAALTFDTTPTANSANPVTSAGIKTALDLKAAPYPFVAPTFALGVWSFSDVSEGITAIQQPYIEGESDPRWTCRFEYDGADYVVYSIATPSESDTSVQFVYNDEGLNLHFTATRSWVCTLAPFANSQLDLTTQANTGITNFTVAVSAAPVAGTMRDLWFVVKSGATAPAITWPSGFVGANGDNDNLVAEANATTVFLVSEYAPGKFLVARQVVEMVTP